MRKLVLFFAAVAAITITSCKSSVSNDPKATLAKFFEALSKKDMKEARKYATKESESMLSMMEMGMKMAEGKEAKETDEEFKKFEKGQMEYGETKIEGDKATVTVTNKQEKEPANFILRKQDGAWKVAFDKASLAEMSGEKMNDEMKNEDMNMNMDSLNTAIQGGLDSLKKEMEKQ